VELLLKLSDILLRLGAMVSLIDLVAVLVRQLHRSRDDLAAWNPQPFADPVDLCSWLVFEHSLHRNRILLHTQPQPVSIIMGGLLSQSHLLMLLRLN